MGHTVTLDARAVSEDIVRRTLADGGVTYSRVSGFVTGPTPDGSRYVVGGVTPAYVVHKDELHTEHVAYMLGNAFSHSRALGTWIDGDSVYIDVVDIVADRDKALALAHERGELAIFDLATFEEISTRKPVAA